MVGSKILSEANQYVLNLFKTQLPSSVLYHDFNHTQQVVVAAEEIGTGMQLLDSELEIVLLAAWFHDTGFVHASDNHEDPSKKEAETFLKAANYAPEKIGKVVGCIEATRMPQNPKNLLEEVICDADLYHLGISDFTKRSNLLRVECDVHGKKQFTDLEWLETTANFIGNHKYFTDYAFKKLHDEKINNWLETQKEFEKLRDKQALKEEKEGVKLAEQQKKQEKLEKPDKGIETMFRVTLRNHMKLSDIADRKANILLSVNAIILSIVLANLMPKLDKESNQFLVMPTLVFILTAVFSIVGAIVSTRPKITSGKFSKQDIENKKANLLFFGNFHRMPLSDFQFGVDKMMNDRDFLYGSMTKDLYFLGVVLARKYRLLRLTYTVFMVGIIVSVIAFVYAFLTMPNDVANTIF